MELTQVVATFATRVLAFTRSQAVNDKAQKLVRAMRGVGEVLGSESLVIDDDTTADGAYFESAAAYFESLLLDASTERIEIGKLAVDVETFVKYNMLDEDDTTTAKAALEAWQKASNGSPKAGRRAS